MSLKLFKRSHEWFYDDIGFIWTSDKDKHSVNERWVIQRLPKNGNKFLCDCEDAAATIINDCITLIINERQRNGRKASDDERKEIESRFYILRVATQQCLSAHEFDHAVALYIDDKGDWWLSDNRYRNSVLNLFDFGAYKFHSAVSIDNMRGIGKPKLIG